MNSQLLKQILIGFLAGVLVTVLIWLALGGKRDDLRALEASNIALKKEVDKGYALKANYEKLRAEVAEQEKMIEELIKIMPTEADKGEIPYRIKKLADTAGIEQVSFTIQGAVKTDYYTEHPFTFQFKAGYHSLGQFASLVSGYEKIINLKDLQMKRESGKGLYPVSATCRISAFVYNPAPPPPPAGKVPARSTARPATSKQED